MEMFQLLKVGQDLKNGGYLFDIVLIDNGALDL
jgi:hypothetical protein